MTKSLYEILGVEPDADAAEIRKAYKSMAHKHHPDREGGDHERFTEIAKAYEILKDDAKREHYDRTGETEETVFDSVDSLLGELFNKAIDQDYRGDIVKKIDKALKNMSRDYGHQIAQIQDELDKLESKLGRVTSESQNVYAIVLSFKIEKGKAALKKSKSELEMVTMAIDRLVKYTDTSPEEEQVRPTGVFIDTSIFSRGFIR